MPPKNHLARMASAYGAAVVAASTVLALAYLALDKPDLADLLFTWALLTVAVGAVTLVPAAAVITLAERLPGRAPWLCVLAAAALGPALRLTGWAILGKTGSFWTPLLMVDLLAGALAGCVYARLRARDTIPE